MPRYNGMCGIEWLFLLTCFSITMENAERDLAPDSSIQSNLRVISNVRIFSEEITHSSCYLPPPPPRHPLAFAITIATAFINVTAVVTTAVSTAVVAIVLPSLQPSPLSLPLPLCRCRRYQQWRRPYHNHHPPPLPWPPPQRSPHCRPLLTATTALLPLSLLPLFCFLIVIVVCFASTISLATSVLDSGKCKDCLQRP